jgi:hypothetical protein
MLGVGAGVATGTSVGYTLDGYAYRTFTAPLPQVEGATRTALKSANQNMTTASVSSTGSQSASSSSGIVSGSGKSHGNSGQEVSGQNRSGEGIVSGSGRSTPGGNAYGKDIVSGSGQAAGGNSGITTAGGHGNSSGQGKSK